MVDLIIRPSSLAKDNKIRWAMQLRYHDLGGTDYHTIARFGDETCSEVLRAGEPYMLFGTQEPYALETRNWREQLAQLEPEEMNAEQARLEVIRLRQLLRAKGIADDSNRDTSDAIGRIPTSYPVA